MINIKKISWILLATASVSSVFANSISSFCHPCKPAQPKKTDKCDDACYEMSMDKPYKQGYEICDGALPKAYNAPANIDICRGINTYFLASFIFWQNLSDQVDLGRSVTTSDTPHKYQAIKFSSEYKPGFKVGFGYHFNHDNWQIFTQYTWLHTLQKTTYHPSPVEQGNFVSSWYITKPGTISYDDISSDGVRARWKMNLDKIDVELSRPFYSGTHFIIDPIAGASNHWLHQSYDFILEENTLPQHIFIKNDSWAIGPKLGLKTKWILYKRFNFILDGSVSLMFSENEMTGYGNEDAVGFELDKVTEKALRDVEEFLIGFSWNSYFTNDKWYFDISASYEAQRYSNTNYMSYYSQISEDDSKQVKPGDTFLHGLTFKVRFDF